ncbi:pectate lyase-like adhesive domain-containing protein [Enterococcus sp. BWR-S5]|uniref:pectate lyase-like adhesive domain-containing protein n=1 Tax=Enterococcus sp. BWR-S5 TaxID=2787714 RepID=UPI001920A4FF|nr:pectate lyase-like adhesive domain-containing protein [Enterococcus sp. BWR-S5]MBL1227187.1 hypothetical protein [Enterococcus sp. BWR-S5]
MFRGYRYSILFFSVLLLIGATAIFWTGDNIKALDSAGEIDVEIDSTVPTGSSFSIKNNETAIQRSADYLEYSDGSAVNYDSNSGIPMFRDQGIPETADNRAEVGTLAQLKAAISASGIHYIYLTADITLDAYGQKISYDKKYMRISGKNPQTGEIHTLTEYKSGWSDDNIHVSNTTSQNIPTSYGFEDINIEGFNYYGPINVNDSSYHVTLTYTNVVYDGPQLTHNLNGTTEYHNMDITIPSSKSGSTETQELVEGHFINIYGDFSMYHQGKHSIAWIGFGGNVRNVSGHFRIKENAKVDITSTGRSFFYFENKDGIFELEKNADVSIVTGGGLIRNDIASSNQAFKKLSVAEDASLKIVRTTSVNSADNNLPTFKMNGDLNVETGGRLYVYNKSDSSGQADEFFRFYNSGGKISVNNAKSVLFYNPKGKIINATTNNYTNDLTAEVQSMNLWRTSVPVEETDITPDNHFSLEDLSNINFDATVTRIRDGGYDTTIHSANPATINAAAMDFDYLKVVSMGIVPELRIDEVTDATSRITGTATASATVVLTYDDGEGERKLTVLADNNGNYSVDIPQRTDSTGAYIKPYTVITGEVFYDFRTAAPITTEVVDVTPPSADPVTTIIEKDAPKEQFPSADQLVENISDKSIGTSHPTVTVDYGTVPIPDLSVYGPVLPKFEVTVTDEAKNSSVISIPIFIKDADTNISADKNFALRAVDFTVITTQYPTTEEALTALIQSQGELALWDIQTGQKLPVTAIGIDKSLLPSVGMPIVGEYPVTVTYGAGQAAVSRTITAKIVPAKANIHVHFQDEHNQKVYETVTINGDVGSTVDLTGNQEVTSGIQNILSRRYAIVRRPDNEAAVEVYSTDSDVYYLFKGTLGLSAPDNVDFGYHEVGVEKIKNDTPKFSSSIKVWDNRADRNEWTLKVYLTKPLTNSSDTTKVLRDSIKFDDGSTEHIVTNHGIVVETHTHLSSGEYDVSEKWEADGRGLGIEVDASMIPKMGEYQGELTWVLESVP